MNCTNTRFLPNICDQFQRNNFICPSHARLEIADVNYDYVPTLLESPKQLYVTLKFPPPPDMMPGTIARIVIDKGVSKHPMNNPQSSIFYVDDIVGLRVVLVPFKENSKREHILMPNDPSRCPANPPLHNGCLPSGWGFDMRKQDIEDGLIDWLYGFGRSVAHLEYQPRTNAAKWYYDRDVHCTY